MGGIMFYEEEPPNFSGLYLSDESTDELENEWRDRQTTQRDAMLAAAVRLAVKRDQTDLALALVECQMIDLAAVSDRWEVRLACSAEVYDVLERHAWARGAEEYPELSALDDVFAAVVPPSRSLFGVVFRVRPDPVTTDWREQLRSVLDGGEATNQGRSIGTSPIHTYNGLNYRSKSEIAVAMELDKRRVLFLPNCRASRAPVTREADFLVFHSGRYAVLEVDGPTHRGRAADDHKRDLFFKEAGIPVHHFTAEDAYNTPQMVVAKFLQLMVASGR
jgi:hypothetical protein